MWQIIKKSIAIIYEISSYKKGQGKSIWRSKTLWVNIVAVIGMLLSKYAGIEISSDEQIAILGAVNVIMRLISKDEVGLVERE